MEKPVWERVPSAVCLGNVFGKLVGSTQVNELDEIETPIHLTSTLSVPRVADVLINCVLSFPGNDHRNLNRLAARAMMGLARTGSGGGHSGDYVFAFAAAPTFGSEMIALHTNLRGSWAIPVWSDYLKL